MLVPGLVRRDAPMLRKDLAGDGDIASHAGQSASYANLAIPVMRHQILLASSPTAI